MSKSTGVAPTLSLVTEIWYDHLPRLGVDPHPIRDYRPLTRLQRHVASNIHRRVPLAEAARVAGFERTYFSQYFHDKVGVTFSRWVNAMRVSRAIELLLHTQLSCAEVCAAVGYRDIRTFQRNFKRLAGTSPTAFRAAFLDG
ncbi:MAG TPA: AraC family transcriptional regulator [Thermoanaerobaculia bacterium]|nr:AraC family transcriptional regulator [Thermoanaerobaculia bacterium]